jgi:3-oxoacyl-[acyl-carrier protein] reductase
MTTSKEMAALVTGGSLGIGADICERLLKDGMRVINLSNQAPKITHPKLVTVNVDLTDRVATEKSAKEIAEKYQVIKFVHCAGAVRPARLEDVKLQDLDYLAQLHLGCAITLMQHFLPSMRAAQFGRVVLISSRAVLGLETRTAYSSTKAAMIGMARTWALEFAKDGITVNAIAPGPILTELFHQHIPDAEKQAAIAKTVPVQRLGKPGDIGRAVHFLLDRENGFITGQTWYICGGASLGVISM